MMLKFASLERIDISNKMFETEKNSNNPQTIMQGI